MGNDSISELINKLEAVHLDTTADAQMEEPATSMNAGGEFLHFELAVCVFGLGLSCLLVLLVHNVLSMFVDRMMRRRRAFELVDKLINMPHTSYHALDSSTSEEEEYEDVDVNKTTKDTTKVAKGNRWKLKRQNAFDKS